MRLWRQRYQPLPEKTATAEARTPSFFQCARKLSRIARFCAAENDRPRRELREATAEIVSGARPRPETIKAKAASVGSRA